MDCPLVGASPQVVLSPSDIALVAAQREITQILCAELHGQPQHEHPLIILFGGYQGSGKTTMAACLQRSYGMAIVSKDRIRRCLMDRGYKPGPIFTDVVDSIHFDVVRYGIEHRCNLVLDCNAHTKTIDSVNSWIERYGPQFTCLKILLETDFNTLVRRIEQRAAKDHTYQGTVDDLLRSLDKNRLLENEYDLVINTSDLIEFEIKRLLLSFIYPFVLPQMESPLGVAKQQDRRFYDLRQLAYSIVQKKFRHLAKLKQYITIFNHQLTHIEYQAAQDLDVETLERTRRPFDPRVDRHAEHVPYAFNQVVLNDGTGVSASLIELKKIDNQIPNMIAAQGPTRETLIPFWKMVIEKDAPCIVMLTELVDEKGRERCYPYFPSKIGEKIELPGYGYVELACQTVSGEKFSHSLLHVHYNGRDYLIPHFWLKGWVDGMDLLDVGLMNALIHQMQMHIELKPNGCPVIHCSGGVGRTGNLIANYVLNRIASPYKWSQLDRNWIPFELLLYLRSQRSHLLHTFVQYESAKKFAVFIK